ncbi:hypothetical protein SK128_028416 [Halocaridina rubra]|uniref:Uncharacterized protein n=1 Tax=Halocaridina rubra TaxID=373956 RepID=A0AAN9A719_HALRR
MVSVIHVDNSDPTIERTVTGIVLLRFCITNLEYPVDLNTCRERSLVNKDSIMGDYYDEEDYRMYPRHERLENQVFAMQEMLDQLKEAHASSNRRGYISNRDYDQGHRRGGRGRGTFGRGRQHIRNPNVSVLHFLFLKC